MAIIYPSTPWYLTKESQTKSLCSVTTICWVLNHGSPNFHRPCWCHQQAHARKELHTSVLPFTKFTNCFNLTKIDCC